MDVLVCVFGGKCKIWLKFIYLIVYLSMLVRKKILIFFFDLLKCCVVVGEKLGNKIVYKEEN